MKQFDRLIQIVTKDKWYCEDKPEHQEKAKKFEEARRVLESLFPVQKIISQNSDISTYSGSPMHQVTEERLFSLSNPVGEESFRLRKYILVRYCFCGCKDRTFGEKYYILDENSSKLNESTWDEEDDIETRILLQSYYSEDLRGSNSWDPMVTPDFWSIVPGAMDEWVKNQFIQRDNSR